MGKIINLWSFGLAILCVMLFLCISFSGLMKTSVMGMHPLQFVFYLTLGVFVLSVAGFSGIHHWKSIARSIVTVIITVVLAAILAFILFFGTLLS